MGIVVKDNGGSFEPIPTGMFPAVCFNVWDMGMQPGFQGQGFAHKLAIGWEISERKTAGEEAGKRFTVTQGYTASLNEKANLRRDLESWRGRPFTAEELHGFDVEKLIGAPCMLNLMAKPTQTGKTWTTVAAVTRLAAGSERLTPETPRDWTPQWILDRLNVGKAETSPEQSAEPPFTDDIPF